MRWLWGRKTIDPATVPSRIRAPRRAPLTAEDVRRAAAQHLSGDASARVLREIRPSLRLLHADGHAVVGHLGGPARLNGSEWPTWHQRPLSVVAGLDLAALAAYPDPVGGLPRSGWLTFFYDAEQQGAWGFDPEDRGAWRIVHSASSEPVTGPAGLALPEVALGAVSEVTLPDGEEPVLSALQGDDRDAYYDVLDALRQDDEPVHRIGGWPQLVQGELWVSAQLASSGVYVGNPEGYRDPRVPALRAGAADWRLLLQLDSDDAASTMWGDVGRLYFTARQDDLVRGAVEEGWFELQCS
jgi:hypothetical protein